MAEKKRALGKGLSALLKNPDTDITSAESIENSTKIVGSISELPLNQIEVNPFQPRTDFDEDTLQELAVSIKELGVIQPITVRKLGYDKFQLISGERRYRASQIAGLNSIPVYIRIANDQEMLEMALVENIQREQLNPVEVALSYQRLIDECKLTQEKMSERVGKKRSTITNYLRLLKLPAEILSSLKNEEISMGHARALINVNNPETQLNIFRDAISNKFTVREIEQIVKDFGNTNYTKTSRNRTKSIPTFEHQKISNDLSHSLGKEVKLKVLKSGKGKVEIKFNSAEELDEIIKKLG
ncbi:MAG: ParB/RepB/Spo0J family partition protein [Flavobacteriales bacterium]|nr:ParB/RepB/Spo0J family partition protein [Flavobacteriales bacterium]MBL6873322.1 ParB/RepB/Spo0J family partition protein [Flavobacteriales bacterium]